MKYFALVLLVVSVVSANVYDDALDKGVNDVVTSFKDGMENARHLSAIVGETGEEVDSVRTVQTMNLAFESTKL